MPCQSCIGMLMERSASLTSSSQISYVMSILPVQGMPMNCNRCGKETNVHIMSMFNTEEICIGLQGRVGDAPGLQGRCRNRWVNNNASEYHAKASVMLSNFIHQTIHHYIFALE
jgi:hypothetical protein